MPARRLPVRPHLEQLQRQAKEFLHAVHTGDPNAIAELHEHHPEPIEPSAAKLADAHLVLARSYGVSSWTRLVHAVQLAEAIWRDDLDSVRALITQNPALIREHVLIRTDSNWGPPMSYAANLGRDSDVVAAVYGQLAGAYHGVSAIPGIWRNSLMKHEVVIDTADRLLTHALVTLGD